jgi:hypothetical protein
MQNPLKNQNNDKNPFLADPGEGGLIEDVTPRAPLSDNLHQAANQLAGDPTLTQEQRRNKLWQQVRANPPSMPPQRMARWGDDADRRNAAMDGLMNLVTDPQPGGPGPGPDYPPMGQRYGGRPRRFQPQQPTAPAA